MLTAAARAAPDAVADIQISTLHVCRRHRNDVLVDDGPELDGKSHFFFFSPSDPPLSATNVFSGPSRTRRCPIIITCLHRRRRRRGAVVVVVASRRRGKLGRARKRL